MKIKEVVKDSALLKKNYEALLDSETMPVKPMDDLVRRFLEMPTTHTFGYQKMFFVNKMPKTVYPARSILFEEKALLSDQLRRKNNNSSEPESQRTMTKAREYGLDEYVFSYLGIHEYYYSQYAGMNIPAFGVFLSAGLDGEKDGTNATLYDLESELAQIYKPEDITLHSVDARTLTAYEICNKYKNDIQKYWINENYATTQTNDEPTWKHKREFHYLEKVEIEHVKAIIWPLELLYIPSTGKLAVKDVMLKEITNFKTLYPGISVFTYIWNGEQAMDRFAKASRLISDHIFSTGNLPGKAFFQNAFMKVFPEPRI